MFEDELNELDHLHRLYEKSESMRLIHGMNTLRSEPEQASRQRQYLIGTDGLHTERDDHENDLSGEEFKSVRRKAPKLKEKFEFRKGRRA